MSMPTQNMTDHQKNQLLDTLMYYLSGDTRGKVMREVPLAYNAYVGREVVTMQVAGRSV